MQKKTILTLEQHQKILYEILYKVDDFCKAHDIQYFLVGGTLLGAVRHQGIIPWDDDIDIAMTRDNYELFIKEYKRNPIKGYNLLNIDIQYWYDLAFSKVTKENTYMSKSIHYNKNYEIFIDILVFDGCGDNYEDAINHFLKINTKIRHITKLLNEPTHLMFTHWKSKIIYYLYYLPLLYSGFIKKHYLKTIFKAALSKKVCESKYSACIVNGLYGKGEVIETTSITNLNYLKFGERNLPVPSDWDTYLKGIYGDYMTPLPENKRQLHSKDYSYVLSTE